MAFLPVPHVNAMCKLQMDWIVQAKVFVLVNKMLLETSVTNVEWATKDIPLVINAMIHTLVIPVAKVTCLKLFTATSKMTHIYVECTCDTDGSSSQACDSTSGKCSCKSELIVGDNCDKCKTGYFGFPDCKGKYNNKLALDS